MRSFIIRSLNTGAILLNTENYEEACVVREYMLRRELEQGRQDLSFGSYTIFWDALVIVVGFTRS